MPMVSVLMPVYNCEKYIRDAVESILSQTFQDFELLIINNGSADGTAQTLQEIQDPRIRLIDHQENWGIVRALNQALTMAQGRYIARMDGDDVALPGRLRLQTDFLQKNPEIGVVGASALAIGETGRPLRKMPRGYHAEEIPLLLLAGNPFIHPNTMFRKEVLLHWNIRYEESDRYMEDYGLWVNLLGKTQMASLPDVTLHYRIVSSGVSQSYCRNCAEVVKVKREILLRAFRHFGIRMEPSVLEAYARASCRIPGITADDPLLAAAFENILSSPLLRDQEFLALLRGELGLIWWHNSKHGGWSLRYPRWNIRAAEAKLREKRRESLHIGKEND